MTMTTTSTTTTTTTSTTTTTTTTPTMMAQNRSAEFLTFLKDQRVTRSPHPVFGDRNIRTLRKARGDFISDVRSHIDTYYTDCGLSLPPLRNLYDFNRWLVIERLDRMGTYVCYDTAERVWQEFCDTLPLSWARYLALSRENLDRPGAARYERERVLVKAWARTFGRASNITPAQLCDSPAVREAIVAVIGTPTPDALQDYLRERMVGQEYGPWLVGPPWGGDTGRFRLEPLMPDDKLPEPSA